jgi:16S rRNA (guanine527-N7)-methyltransferase
MADIADLLPRFNTRQIELFVSDLLAWNPRLGLVSKQNTAEVIARLIRQSVALWEFATAEAILALAEKPWRVADVGTGGGFPGIVWKLLEPRIHLALIERKERKSHFLQTIVHRMRLEAVRVEAQDVAELARREEYAGRFDLAAMMAVALPGELGPAIEALLRPGGLLATIRPRHQQILEQRAGDTLTLVKSEDTPGGTLVLYQHQ